MNKFKIIARRMGSSKTEFVSSHNGLYDAAKKVSAMLASDEFQSVSIAVSPDVLLKARTQKLK